MRSEGEKDAPAGTGTAPAGGAPTEHAGAEVWKRRKPREMRRASIMVRCVALNPPAPRLSPAALILLCFSRSRARKSSVRLCADLCVLAVTLRTFLRALLRTDVTLSSAAFSDRSSGQIYAVSPANGAQLPSAPSAPLPSLRRPSLPGLPSERRMGVLPRRGRASGPNPVNIFEQQSAKATGRELRALCSAAVSTGRPLTPHAVASQAVRARRRSSRRGATRRGRYAGSSAARRSCGTTTGPTARRPRRPRRRPTSRCACRC